MSAHPLLSRLSKVKKTGHGTWIACCPAHDDRHPSLSVREKDDGLVLLRCHAQECAVQDIVAAIGLDLSDLFPERPSGDYVKRERRPFNPSDVLTCIAHEALIVALLAADLHKNRAVSESDYERLMTASARLSAASEIGSAS